MKVMFYASPGSGMDDWLNEFAAALPGADCRQWQDGDNAPADYAIVWRPPAAMLEGRHALKGIFNLGAGVDAILQLGDTLPPSVPLIRVDDGGMAIQMAEYVTHAILGYFRCFDAYQQQATQREWRPLPRNQKQDFSVGILGLGVLGARIAAALAHFEFPLNGWSRTQKDLPGMHCYAGDDGLDAFLRASRVLVCILPLTPDTHGILNRENMQKLQKGHSGAYIINVARGGHLVEDDLLALIKSGDIAGATLDVFSEEPLPLGHPFWQEPRISMTPHISAMSDHTATIRQISNKIRALQRGEAVSGVVNHSAGY
ncbi:2-hydroxyacid dehydrogenase [Glaciimonas immobilis]|uniref:Glyoxylate/hydroxypyruvate reductase A n=1 Tax=Glaciimonas immobilis TaxID=728004 RepID=A0A840RT93_9BURK|nr:glyoxylate/hydroxypyruvate reductase A [Glaciimonas immobilis]KAF3996873.1 glyoxylate/hydroxypyruvate reductase A [Glaciimonas immobilis]MBB5199679.1 glyoxylate/hydroxypyruvate reductase A [Glaciimonas immobilis]